MRILSLRFCNLNSIYGEWSIDFTAKQYRDDGIFAITGATGSGKTTILDAISLALYGQTARLGKITASVNDIMSKGMGECFAEVVFESSKGIFKCFWGQKRANKSADGKLQQPKHEIWSEKDHKILESRKNEVLKAVEEATGMNYNQFLRSIMLAQGDFAAFLDASPSERSPILEQITGTEIYSRISMKVHEKKSEEDSKLSALIEGMGMIKLLSPEERAELDEEKRALIIHKNSLRDKIELNEKHLRNYGEINKLKSDILVLSKEQENLNRSMESQRDDFSRLDRYKRSLVLDVDYANSKNYHKLWKDYSDRSKKASADCDNVSKELVGLKDALALLTQEYHQSQSLLAKEKEIAKSVGGLDNNIATLKDSLREEE